MDKINKIMFPIAVGAFFVNICLLIFGAANGFFGLEMLSIGNMMLLSFVLLGRESEE